MTVRNQLIVFLLLTFAVSWAFMAYIVQIGGMSKAGFLIVLIMWIPGFVCLGLRAAAKLGFKDVGLKRGAGKYWRLAFFVPLGIAAVAYAISWALGIGEIKMPPAQEMTRMGIQSPLGYALTVNALSFIVGLVGALGEELGWRGFLVPKLIESGIKQPLPVSAVIWGVWHMPLVIWGDYASSDYVWLSFLLIMVIIMTGGVMIGWLRMASGSVWVATMAHAAHNLFLQTTFEMFNKPGPLSPYLAGESGVIPCTLYAFVFFAALRLLRSNSTAL